MSDTPAGRRGNGLQSADWGALVDVDPRLAEGLLDRLAAAEVAAYVEPASATDPFSRAPLPSRPLDRLWVDPARAEQARAVVAAEVAGLPESGLVQPVPRHAARRVLPPPPLPAAPVPAPAPVDEDEVFRQIVAGFHTTTADPVPRWPVVEDDTPSVPPAAPAPPAAPRRRRDDEALPAWLEPEALDPAEDDGGFVPPPPPPAPRVQPRTLVAVLVLVLGLLFVFAPGLLDQSSTPGTILLGVALMAGGAGALVWWVRDARDDDGPSDGAVV